MKLSPGGNINGARMTDQELLYTMALTMALRYHSKHQRTLLDTLGSATAVYENRSDIGRFFEDLSPRLGEAIATMAGLLPQCEKELAYARAHQILMIAIGDADYPRRLRQCEDAPILIYTLGNADFNAAHVVSIVGTRRCTERGRELAQQLVAGIAAQCPGTLIVSGLAYGVDVAAHRASLEAGLPTVGILAHGLDEIYPRSHRQTAIEMLKLGGLLTEFTSHTPIDRLNFLQRNRIVAGLADAVVIVESPARGGSLNTARLANDYQRDVFAFPGRPSDVNSEGCNLLIRRNGAVLITSADDLLSDLGWQTTAAAADKGQTMLFPDLTAEEQALVDALRTAEADLAQADLAVALDMPVYKLTPLILALEMKGVVKVLPGNKYHLVGL